MDVAFTLLKALRFCKWPDFGMTKSLATYFLTTANKQKKKGTNLWDVFADFLSSEGGVCDHVFGQLKAGAVCVVGVRGGRSQAPTRPVRGGPSLGQVGHGVAHQQHLAPTIGRRLQLD